jgi:hypothetical protein
MNEVRQMTKLIVLLAASVASLMVAPAAFAQQAGAGASCAALVEQGTCMCAMANVPGTSPGLLTSAQGQVVVSGPASFSPANGPVGLNVGTGVFLGPGATATVAFGPACQNRALAAPGNYSVSAVEGCACLKSEPRSNGVLFGGIVVTGIAVSGYLLHLHNKPLSP